MKYNIDNRAQRIIDIFDLHDIQLNLSVVNSTEHVVAWHKHNIQTDYFYCIKGSFQVGLATIDNCLGHYEFKYLTDKDPITYIKIEPGTYHGYKALEPGSIMLYHLSHKYNPDDEHRVPVGTFKEDWGVPNK